MTDVPPWTFALWRAVLLTAFLASLTIVFRLGLPRDRTTWLAAISQSINSGISWAIIFWAEQFVPSGLVAVFGATAPIWTAVLAHFLVHGDRLSALRVAALGLGFSGIAVLVGTSGEIPGGPVVLAVLLLTIMPLGWAATAVVAARSLTTVHPVPVIGIGAVAGGIFLVPLALSEIGRPVAWTPQALLALVYLAFVGSGVGLVVNLWLYRRLRPTTIALSQLLITAEAVLVGAFLLGEQVTLGMIAGAALVLTAIWLNSRAGRPTVPPEAALPERAVATPAD